MRTFACCLVVILSGCSDKSPEKSLFEKAAAAKIAGTMDSFCADHASLSEDEMAVRISTDLKKRAESGGHGLDPAIADGKYASMSEDDKAKWHTRFEKMGRDIWSACHPKE